MKKTAAQLVYSPSDLIRYVASPFASWMDRYHLEHPGEFTPDAKTDDEQLIANMGDKHERSVLADYTSSTPGLVEIAKSDRSASATTRAAIAARAPVIYQAVLAFDSFEGYADFLVLDRSTDRYEVWDTKLARSPKSHYPVQLCAYSEMLAATPGGALPERFGIILGNKRRTEFLVEDFIHYFRRVKADFLALQMHFTGRFEDRPEPLPRADHGRWTTCAEEFFARTDHLVRVAGITVGQVRKLNAAGITTMASLAGAADTCVNKLAPETLRKLSAQARLQRETTRLRDGDPAAHPRYELLPTIGRAGEPVGLATLPPEHAGDAFFDMEGYPLVDGGLEYLFGVHTPPSGNAAADFEDWWAHDRASEKVAFERFIDWAFARWKANPGMHIYHYAAYEVSAVRRLSTRHDTRQDEVDDLLRNEVFVDLYQVLRHAVRVGEADYSIKTIERLYRAARKTDVATAAQSIVEYARWIESGEPRGWRESPILRAIRDYNEDDCKSTAELFDWLRARAVEQKLTAAPIDPEAPFHDERQPPADVVLRTELVAALRQKPDATSATLADLVDFHRREAKPAWWRMFDRAKATPEELCDDPACIHGVEAVGAPAADKRSLVQSYQFPPEQECKLAAGDRMEVMFAHRLDVTLRLNTLDARSGTLQLKLGTQSVNRKFGGTFPPFGSLIAKEVIEQGQIVTMLTDVATRHLADALPAPTRALLDRKPPAALAGCRGEPTINAAVRVATAMAGECLVIQGPPGTGKTYTAASMIDTLLSAGKRIGVTSNSHKAVLNLFRACDELARRRDTQLSGIKVGGDPTDRFFADTPTVAHVADSGSGRAAYTGGIVGGTAWLFCRPEWIGELDFLFIDEAGQVPLANAVAMSCCAHNLVLLGDQMQLEQPVQGLHPGDAWMSALQYALKDTQASREDAPVLHAVVPPQQGLFLGESRRMHPDVCRFISESIYGRRLASHADCARERVAIGDCAATLVTKEAGIVFSGVEHEGNVQRSDEEVDRVRAIYEELLGRKHTSRDGNRRQLALADFLFVAPYNAQVRALEAALPPGARVGSVDKFQGQEAPVCILSLCSSFGEYGSRGLSFILDRNRINVAISRAQCLAVVVADPRIAATAAGSIDEMALVNLFAKLVNTA